MKRRSVIEAAPRRAVLSFIFDRERSALVRVAIYA